MSFKTTLLGLGRDVALLGCARACASILGLLAVMILAARLDAATLGGWSMLLAAQGYALHVSEMGLRSVVTAEAGSSQGGPLAVMVPYLVLRLPLAVMVTILTTTAIAVVEPAVVIPAALVTATILPVALHFDWLALVNERYASAAMLLLARPLAWVLLLFALPVLDLEAVALIFLLAWTLAALLSLSELFRPQRQVVEGSTRPLDKRTMLRLGWPLFLGTLANQILQSGDLLVIGLVIGSEAAGFFYLASAVAVAGMVFANALGQYALSVLGATRPPRTGRVGGPFVTLMVLAVMLGACAALGGAVLVPLLVPIVFGEAYRVTAWLFLFLLPWLFLQYPSSVMQAACVTRRRQGALLAANAAMLGVFLTGLALAAWLAKPEIAALSRGAAEFTRLWLLGRALGGDRRLARGYLRKGIRGRLAWRSRARAV